MNVFVTGASGQLGRPLVRALVARGDRVSALVGTDAAAELARGDGARAVRGRLEDGSALADGLRGCDLVVHLAGGVRGRGSVDADALNRIGTERVIDAARTAGSPTIVFASTCAVYGDRSGLWVPEDYPTSPNTAYGASKVAAENALLSSGLRVRVARIAAVFGPGFRFLQREGMKSGTAWLPGEGRNHVPLVHVDDAVGVLLAVADRGEDGRTYHVSGRSTPTLAEFYTAVHARAGGTPVRFWSTWVPSALQFGAAALNERLASRLGLKPRFTADNLRLFTASVRLRVERLEKELGYTWVHADHLGALDATFS